jgi:prophage DNA circulation protein
MTWYDQLKGAAFRGVPFQTDTSDRSEGLNTVLREYPFQDLPTIFSMGQASGEIKFSAYVIGNDYIEQMNALEKALLVPESGVLIHPTIGSLRVMHHGRFTIKEAFVSEGGMARFDLTFIRAEARRYPTEAANTSISAFTAAVQAAVASVQAFTGQYNLNGIAGWVRANVYNNLQTLHGAVFDVCYSVKQGTDGFGELLEMGRSADNLLRDSLLIPQDLGAHFASLFGLEKNYSSAQAASAVAALLPQDEADAPAVLLPDSLPMRDPRLHSLLTLEITPTASPYITASRRAEAACAAALTSLCQRLAYCALAQAAAQMSYANYDVALTVRRAIHNHGQRLLFAASREDSPLTVNGDRSVHDAIMRVHTATLSHLHQASVSLSRLTTYTPQTDDNIWSISYQLYGTADYADEVWSMNTHITNPLLVPAGQPLRVIDR